MAIQHTTGSFRTADHLTIHAETWQPAHNPRASILLVHGIGEHIGRYAHVAEFLAGKGYGVFGLDHRTHGRSEGQPRVYIPDFSAAVNDLKQYFDSIKQEHPLIPIFIYGHSMGSFLATLFALRYQDQLAGFISSGSPLLIDTLFPALVKTIGSILKDVIPQIPVVPLGLDGISRDPAVLDDYFADPLVHTGRVRVRMAVGYNHEVVAVREQISNLRLPLLVLHGGADPITPVSGSSLLYERASSADKTLRIYPGLYHEIHNEPEKQVVMADIAGWLANAISTSG